MRKNLISAIAIVLILVVSSFGFAGCGKKDDKKDDTVVPATTTTTKENANNVVDNNDDEDVVYETVYVMVTDKNGQPQTNDKNEAITEVSKVKKSKITTKKAKKTKKAVKTQEVKGGTDPYVEDPF